MIASGNHLLTQVKDNQPSLRHLLELGAAGRKPRGCATSQSKGRNRWETRKLTVFPAKAWFRHTAWEPFIKTVLRLERTIYRRDPATGLLKQTIEVVYWVSSAAGPTPECWNEWIRVWRDNLDEKSATIWMRFFGRGDEMIVAERQYGKQDLQRCSL